MAQVAERCMAMHNLCLFADEYLSHQRERAEHCRKCCASIDNPMWKMVHFDAIRQVSNARSRWRVVSVGDDYHTVSAIDEFLISVSYCWSAITYGFCAISKPNRGRVSPDLPMTAGRCDFQHLQAVDRRNPISC
jgi:hypothetical protein